MKSILEQALVHLLNEDREKANELMHKFIIERARDIHETLREGDEADMDMDDDCALEEEFFTEADLEDAEAVDQLEDDLGDTDTGESEMGAGDVDMGDDADMGDDDMGAGDVDMGGDADVDADLDAAEDDTGDESADLSDKIDQIEDEISALQAEFDKIMAEFSDEEMDGDDDTDVDAVDTDSDAEFPDINESVVDELKKVVTPNVDGMGATGGKQITTKTETGIADDNCEAEPFKSVAKNPHTHFNLETAPKSGHLKKYSNSRNHAKDDTSSVPPSGNKKAELSKPVQGNNKPAFPTKKK